MNYQYEILSRTRAFDGFFHVDVLRLRHELFDGGWSDALTRELFERGRAVAVLPYDPVLDAVVVTEQFRVGAAAVGDHPWLIEFVAGMIEPGEEPENVAHRETEEESGCEIDALLPISEYYSSPGGMAERMHLFCGRVDSTRIKRVSGLESEGEDILVRAIPYTQAVSWLESGKINSATPIIAMQWLMLNRERVRALWA